MKKATILFALVMLAASSAFAHGRGRVHFGLHFGFPLYPYTSLYPYDYYPAPIYHYPVPYTVRVAPSAPPVWVERDDVGREEDAASWWYYCAQSRGYYPYVKSCPGGWERVPPAPPPAR